MESNFELNCFVLGSNHRNIFSVNIAQTDNVIRLRKAIKKEKNAFRDVDADALQLWKVDLPVDDTLKRNLIELELNDKEQLSPVDIILEIFDYPQHNHLHIIIQPPPAASYPSINLNCLVWNGNPGCIFSAKILLTDTVADLRKAIKEEKKHAFCDVDADSLQLWKVDIDLRKGEKLDLPDDAMVLEPLTRLSQVFTVGPEDGYLHIFVQCPHMDSHSHLQPSSCAPLLRTQQLREEYLAKFPKKAPSSQGKPSEFEEIQKDPNLAIRWDRPRNAADTIPSTLLHPIFGEFMDDCENHEPTAADNKLVMALSVAMSGFFTNETFRASKFREILQEHGIDVRATTLSNSTCSTDGDMQYKGLRYAIVEVKNELGSTSTEPHMQALLYYIHSTKTFANNKPSFRFPCLAITLFGPHIDFSAAVWSTRPNMQVISPALPLFYHDTDTKMRSMLARHVGALRKALRTLSECYEIMSSNTTSPSSDRHVKFLDSEFPDPRFPYPHSFTCIKTSSICYFTYCDQMHDTKLLFSAKVTDGDLICIKFVRHYSKEVHQRCASGGFAPALLGFEHLPGGWYMVVMEMIPKDYCCLGELPAPYPHPDVIVDELRKLHQDHYVHGDIRDTNVMVKKDRSPGFMLVDFDWSGIIGQIRYPMNVYRGHRLWRPDGAEDGRLVMAEHDMEMLYAMFPEVTFVLD